MHNNYKQKKPPETGGLFHVELQGFEPWSRQGNRRAFYVCIYA